VITRRKLVLAATLLPAWAAFAQQAKVFRIGVLETTRMEGNANFDVLRRSLRDLGYAEARNLAFEYRSSDGRNERFAELAAELVRLKVDLIVTRGTPATLAAKAATPTIPIVTTAASDPVRTGLVQSLARPGGNVTGLDPLAGDLQVKRLELIKETFPGISRVGSMLDMTNPVNERGWKEAEAAARARGIELARFDVRKADDIAPAFEAAAKQRLGVLAVSIDGLMSANLKTIVQHAARHRVPTMHASREFVDAGAMMSYAVDYRHLYSRAATYIDKIFKGAKAGDLPIERPTKFEMVINLKTAGTLGVTIPPSVRLRADEVIE
jgi:putative ABC transport system substrate-binding protein